MRSGGLLFSPRRTGGAEYVPDFTRSSRDWRFLWGRIRGWPPVGKRLDPDAPGFRERMEMATRLPDAAALEVLRRETGLTTLLVHAGDVGPERRAPRLALAEHGTPTLRLVARAADDPLCAVTAL